jgi:hypothetical protein
VQQYVLWQTKRALEARFLPTSIFDLVMFSGFSVPLQNSHQADQMVSFSVFLTSKPPRLLSKRANTIILRTVNVQSQTSLFVIGSAAVKRRFTSLTFSIN